MLTMAMVTAMSPSVTVSMGEETMGMRTLMFLVMFVVRSTWEARNDHHRPRTQYKRAILIIGAAMRAAARHNSFTRLVCTEINVSWMEDAVVVGVADAL